MTSKTIQPETPFDAIVLERDLISTFTEESKPCTVLYLTLVHADDQEQERPRVFIYAKRFYGDKFFPNIVLRKGHRVRVRALSQQAGQWFVSEIEFDESQLVHGVGAEPSN